MQNSEFRSGEGEGGRRKKLASVAVRTPFAGGVPPACPTAPEGYPPVAIDGATTRRRHHHEATKETKTHEKDDDDDETTQARRPQGPRRMFDTEAHRGHRGHRDDDGKKPRMNADGRGGWGRMSPGRQEKR